MRWVYRIPSRLSGPALPIDLAQPFPESFDVKKQAG